MADFRVAGSEPVLDWLEQLSNPSPEALHSWVLSNPKPPSENMDGDDPWNWSVDRVVQELCTTNRTWSPRDNSMPEVGLAELESGLREQEISGSVLLVDLTENVIREDLKITKLGRRALINSAIEELRIRSSKYQKHIARHGMAGSFQSPSHAAFPHPFPSFPFTPAMLGQLQTQFGIPAPLLPQTPQSHHSPQLGDGQAVMAKDASPHDDFVLPDAKRRKLDLTHPANNLALQPGPGFDPTMLIDEATVPQDMALEEPPTPSPEPNIKKRKRIAPTLISSVVDPNIDRAAPSAADYVIRNAPDNMVPGVPYIGDDGKKRLVPIHRPDSDSEIAFNYDSLRKPGEVGGNISLRQAESIVEDVERKKAMTAEVSLAIGYLGKQKMSVDSIFYGDIKVGQEIPLEQGTTEFSQEPKEISAGRRLYVYSLMKRFLRSDREVFPHKGKFFSAVRPYETNLAPKYQNPSFTLYYAGEDGQIHARREPIPAWPQINPDAPIQKQPSTEEDNSVTFNPGAWEDFRPFSETFDPESLQKWSNYEGGDEVLPLYGESDEENEFDPETWKEMEEELGTLDKPLIPLKRTRLTSEDIYQAIDEGIAEMVVKWHKDKLPKKQRRAYHIWKTSRHHLERRVKIESIQNQLSRLSERIQKMRVEIAGEEWTSQLQVKRQTRIMEQSIFDRESATWEISIMRNKTPPEKPLPKPPSSKKSVVSTVNGEEGESLGSDTEVSSSDYDMDDFIEDDPQTTEEEIELNLADSEMEDEASSYSDASPSKGPTRSMTTPKKPILASIEDLLMEDQAASQADEAPISRDATPRRFSSSPPIKTSPAEDEPSLPKLLPGKPTDIPDVVDLISSDDAAVKKPTKKPISLVTPTKPRSKIVLRNKNSPFRETLPKSPVVISDGDEIPMPDPAHLPSHSDIKAIAEIGAVAWERAFDTKRMLIAVLHEMGTERRNLIFLFIANLTAEELWANMEKVLNSRLAGEEFVRGMDDQTLNTLIWLICLFRMFVECKKRSFEHITGLVIKLVKKSHKKMFHRFFQLCLRFQACFDKSRVVPKSLDGDDSDDEDPQPAAKRRRMVNTSEEDEDEDEDPEESSQHKKRKKPIIENAEARNARMEESQRILDLEDRKKKLRSRMEMGDFLASQNEIIINESKLDNQGLITVNHDIARRIKPHQVEGVRFMWNQIVTNEKVMQGCLLAHTMGLGKTMQVITLLVAIAEASQASDESIYSQIPCAISGSKTLILCPPTLIDNWMDELLTWAPDVILGDIRKVDSSIITLKKRLDTISSWYQKGGILVMGYEMFRNYIENKATKNRAPPLDEDQCEQVTTHLLEGPQIIVADEAHKMKNAKSALARSTLKFKSKSRIALTGSPLANNVEEYHTMIEWVAPNYLGPANEFKAKYVEPIQQGLWHDSTPAERRKALKMLGALQVDLAPKVNRADMSVLRNDLPPKTEFVITLPLTDLQKKAYSIYVRSVLDGSYATTKSGEATYATIWTWLGILSMLCNHPYCFHAKLNERQQAARKENRAIGSEQVSRDNTDLEQEEAIADDLNAPIEKVGVSQGLLNEVTALFDAEAPDLQAIELSYKVKILSQILDASKAVGDKVLVFSQSLQTLDFLQNLCKKQKRKFARLDGSTNMSHRQKLTKEFNAGDLELYLISTTAGGLGLNLYGANRVVIFDFKFNPIMEEQAIGRAYRIGQKKPVFVYRLVAGGTFENSVHNKTIFKMQLASRVVDKKTPIAWARKISDFLFEPKQVDQTSLAEFEGKDPVLDQILATQGDVSTIRGIVQSDTFEKDDEDKLTSEEQKEVDQIISDRMLERSDPIAYHALLQRRQQEFYRQMQRQVQLQNPMQGTSIGPFQAVPQLQSFAQPTSGPTVPTSSSSGIYAAPQVTNGLQHGASNPTSGYSVGAAGANPIPPDIPYKDVSTPAPKSGVRLTEPAGRGRPPISGANTTISKTPSPVDQSEKDSSAVNRKEASHKSALHHPTNFPGRDGDRASMARPKVIKGTSPTLANKPEKSPRDAHTKIDPSTIIEGTQERGRPSNPTSNLRSVTPDGRTSPGRERGSVRRDRSLGPRSPSPTSPKAGYEMSWQLYQILIASLTLTTTGPTGEIINLPCSKKDDTFAKQQSSAIIGALKKYETDTDMRQIAHDKIVQALETDIELCRAIAKGRDADAFVRKYVTPTRSSSGTGMEDITKTEMFKAMNKQPARPPPPPSLRTPVTNSQRKSSQSWRLEADRKRKHSGTPPTSSRKNSALQGEMLHGKKQLDQASAVSKSSEAENRRLNTTPYASSTKIPPWAKTEILEASKDKQKRDARAASNSSSTK